MIRRLHPANSLRFGRRGIGEMQSLQSIFGSDLLAVWPLYGPGLVTHASTVADPTDFSVAGTWVPTAVTTPDAATITETVANSQHKVTQTLAIANGPATVSVDIEANGRTTWAIALNTGIINFTSVGPAVGTQTLGTGTITDLGAGRYRCTVTPTTVVAGSVFEVRCTNADASYSYAGDITKGIKAYNATINQTSIVTAPNLYGAQMLARYGDRFDLTNPTKASQPVLGTDAWTTGYDGAEFSGANWLAADGIAAQFSGDDKPHSYGLAYQMTAATAAAIVLAAASSSNNNPAIQLYSHYGGGVDAMLYRRQDTGGFVSNLESASTLDRSVLTESFSGTTISAARDGVQTINAAACDVTAVNIDRMTLGALRRLAGTTVNASFNARYLYWTSRASTNAELLAASRIIQSLCPIA